jgi:hypothetical protein
LFAIGSIDLNGDGRWGCRCAARWETG